MELLRVKIHMIWIHLIWSQIEYRYFPMNLSKVECKVNLQ